MKPIDSLLRIMVQQDAAELRLASDQRPRMLEESGELTLTIPPTSTKTIQELLADLWTSSSADLEANGQAALSYRSPELGSFEVTLVRAGESDLRVSFRRNVGSGAATAGETAGSGPPPPAPAASPDAAALPAPMTAVLARAAGLGASDVHLSAGGTPIVRIDGELRRLDTGEGLEVTALLGDAALLEQVHAGRSVDRALDVPSVGRLRVNVYASDGGLSAAIRILRREAPALRDLNLPRNLEPLVDLPHGLLLVCGATGSGKSSTLAALAQEILRARARVLISIEDPIEYVIRPMRDGGLVRQREVGTHVSDFATGLRDALREDPDVLLVGEMRDAETIGFALTAAETGHLVLASLHSRTAASAVERIVDTYPPERQRQIRVQLADALRAVISQRLLRRTGGQGRVPAVELLKVTHAVANLIREGRTAQIASALQAGGDEGMLPLERSLAELVRSGVVGRDAARAVANDPSTLAEYLRS